MLPPSHHPINVRPRGAPGRHPFCPWQFVARPRFCEQDLAAGQVHALGYLDHVVEANTYRSPCLPHSALERDLVQC